jgi:hypothetical protein
MNHDHLPIDLSTMLTRRTLMLGAACAAIAAPVRAAADASAVAFMTEIYNAYKGKKQSDILATTSALSGVTSSHRSRR